MYFANTANVIPNAIPRRTSLGKCTNRYNLENATSKANIINGIPAFLLYRKTDIEAANAQPECVEGQE